MVDAHGTFTVGEAKRFAHLVRRLRSRLVRGAGHGRRQGRHRRGARRTAAFRSPAGKAKRTRYRLPRSHRASAAADILQPDLGQLRRHIRSACTSPRSPAASISGWRRICGPARPPFSPGCMSARRAMRAIILEYSLGANPMIHDHRSRRRVERRRRHDRHSRTARASASPSGRTSSEVRRACHDEKGPRSRRARLAALLIKTRSLASNAAVGAGTGRAFRCQPRPDPRSAGDPRSPARRRAPGQIGHLCSPRTVQHRGAGVLCAGRACRSLRRRSTRRSRCARSTRSPRCGSPASAPQLENFDRLRDMLGRDAKRGSRRASRSHIEDRDFPSRDRARDAEQRVLQDRQRLLSDEREAPAALFRQPRALAAVACGASADFRALAKRDAQPRHDADERASAGG